jgi:hypothetical protein
MAEKSGSGGDDRVWIFGGLALIAVYLFVPFAIAAGLWYLLARHLSKREFWALVGLGVLGWSLSFANHLKDYSLWLVDLVERDISLDGVPFFALLSAVCFMTGLLGVLGQSSVATKKMPKRMAEALKVGTPVHDPTIIIPTAQTKAALKPASPLGGTVISSHTHSIQSNEPRGKRSFPLGIGLTGQTVWLNEAEVGTHGVILGATGSGKSKTIEGLAGALLDLGWSGMILDLKEDTAPGGLRDWCNTYANSHSLPYQELRLSDAQSKFWFNSLTGMGPDEIRDTILTLSDFDDAYWQALNKELLGQAVNLSFWAHQADPKSFPEPNMYDIGRMLSTGDLKNATKKHRAVVLAAMPTTVTKEDFRVLENPSKDQQTSAVGFGSKLTLIYDTQAGRTVLREGAPGEKRMVDVTAKGITYIGLDSQGKADLTGVISSSVLQRMSVYAAARVTGLAAAASEDDRRFLIVDESNWVNRTIVQNLLSRARSAKIAMFLCTQGPKDWIDKNGDDWGKLTQNTNVAIIMRQGEPDSAEICAEYIGKHRVTSTSRSKRVADGMFGEVQLRDADGRRVETESERESEEYLVEPEALRQMGVGEAVIKVGVPNRVEWLKVSLRDPTTSPHTGPRL